MCRAKVSVEKRRGYPDANRIEDYVARRLDGQRHRW
jgi:hypothetical protein